jgi:hypothetical protein
VPDEREDEFTLWDDADVNEAKALARPHRGNRYRLFSPLWPSSCSLSLPPAPSLSC